MIWVQLTLQGDDDSLAPPLPPLPQKRDSDIFSDSQEGSTPYNDPYSQPQAGHVLGQNDPSGYHDQSYGQGQGYDQSGGFAQPPMPHGARRESEGQWSEGDSEVLLLREKEREQRGWRQG